MDTDMALTHQYLGTTTPGASDQVPSTVRTYAKQITIPANTLLGSVGVHINSTDAEQITAQFAVYADNAGAPGEIIGVSLAGADTVALDGRELWYEAPFGMWFASETTVWVGVHFYDPGTATISYDASGGSDYHITAGGAWMAQAGSLGITAAASTNDYSIRASVTTGWTGISTKGDATAGASDLVMTTGRWYAKKVALTEGDLVATINAHLSHPTQNVIALDAGIWTDNAGAPGTWLGASVAQVTKLLLDSTKRAVAFPIGLKVPTTGNYWVAVKMVGATSVSISYDTTGGSDGRFDATSDAPAFTAESTDYSISATVVTPPISPVELGVSTEGATELSAAFDTAYAVPITVPADGMVFGVEVAAKAPSGTVGFLPGAAVYADNAGNPGNLIAFRGRSDSGPRTIGTTTRWAACPFFVWLPAGDYWVAATNLATGTAVLLFDTGSVGDGATIDGGKVGSLPDGGITGAAVALGDSAYSVYGVYIGAAAMQTATMTLETGGDVIDASIDGINDSPYRVAVDWNNNGIFGG